MLWRQAGGPGDTRARLRVTAIGTQCGLAKLNDPQIFRHEGTKTPRKGLASPEITRFFPSCLRVFGVKIRFASKTPRPSP